MTKYLQSTPFSVKLGGKAYREGWDAIDWGKKEPEQAPPDPAPKYTEFTFTVVPSSGDPDRIAKVVRDSLASFATVDDESDIRKQVREFHEAFGLPVSMVPGEPNDRRVKLRLKLIAEEFLELLDSVLSIPREAIQTVLNAYIDRFDSVVDAVDIVEFADACADLDYVVEGARLEFGINGKPIADEVHRSNMAKLGPNGKPLHRADGKVIKPEGWAPPNIAGELAKQGAFL